MSASHQRGEHTHPASFMVREGGGAWWVWLAGGDFVSSLFFLVFFGWWKMEDMTYDMFCLESCQHKNGNEPTGNNNLVQLIRRVTSKNFRCVF